MPSSSPPTPALWVSLALPSDADLSAELAELLSGLRIPAAVRHTLLFGAGTIAMVPTDAEISVLAMAEGYGPEVEWVHADESLLITALDALAGPAPSSMISRSSQEPMLRCHTTRRRHPKHPPSRARTSQMARTSL